jgi:hypothetical protein
MEDCSGLRLLDTEVGGEGRRRALTDEAKDFIARFIGSKG